MEQQVHSGARRGGFTLVEVMVAMVIFAVGSLALMAMQIHALHGEGAGRHATRAASIAQSQMEQLQNTSWTALAPTAGWTAPVTRTTTVQSNPNSVEQAYQVDWQISDLVAGWTRQIDVRVSWADENRPARTVTLSSIRFNREGV